jgi:hypothetical protein
MNRTPRNCFKLTPDAQGMVNQEAFTFRQIETIQSRCSVVSARPNPERHSVISQPALST